MIEFLKFWAKSLGLAIVIVSILEMLLPNNKTKKYIRMVMGMYILFSIISPLIKNKEIFATFNENNFENITNSIDSTYVNQTSMDRRIEELYSKELEKDISKKLKDKGYNISKCKVTTEIGDTEEKTKIKKIRLVINEKNKNEEAENAENIENSRIPENNESIENVIVQEIQKVKVAINNEKADDDVNKEEKNEKDMDLSINKDDIKNIRNFLIDEYGVREECLEIN